MAGGEGDVHRVGEEPAPLSGGAIGWGGIAVTVHVDHASVRTIGSQDLAIGPVAIHDTVPLADEIVPELRAQSADAREQPGHTVTRIAGERAMIARAGRRHRAIVGTGDASADRPNRICAES